MPSDFNPSVPIPETKNNHVKEKNNIFTHEAFGVT